MSGLIEVAGPAIEPVSNAEGKAHLRLDEDIDDLVVATYIKAARVWAENYTGRVFISRSFKQYLNGFHGMSQPYWEGQRTAPQTLHFSSSIELAAVPLISVESIKYYDDSDTESTWDASNYYVDAVSDIGKIVLRDGGTFPTDLRAANGLEINFTAGYGTSASSVPESIRIAILQYMTFMYEHRGDFERFPPPTPPVILRTLLNPYKVLRFGSNPYSKLLKSGIG